MDEMRACLDSLMGPNRNETVKSRKSFKDMGVCHFYVLDFCPHDLFPNTKQDLGPCPYLHSESLKCEFQSDPDHDYYQWKYEEEFIDRLQRLIHNVELRIKRGNERISGHDEEQIEKEREKKLDAMRAEVSGILKLAERAGESGNIEDAEAQTAKANELRRKIDMVEGTPLMAISIQEKSLRVCEICSAMQSTGDATSRFESHVNGKQHKGYELIRSTFAKLVEKHKHGNPPHMSRTSSGSKSGKETKADSTVRLSETHQPGDAEDTMETHRRVSGSRIRRSSSNDRYNRRSRDRSRDRYRTFRSPRAAKQRCHEDDSHHRYNWRDDRFDPYPHRRRSEIVDHHYSQKRTSNEGHRRPRQYDREQVHHGVSDEPKNNKQGSSNGRYSGDLRYSHSKGEYQGRASRSRSRECPDPPRDKGHARDRGQDKDKSHSWDKGHGRDKDHAGDEDHARDKSHAEDEGHAKDKGHTGDERVQLVGHTAEVDQV